MLLVRLSGHSAAGKSRLVAALPSLGVTVIHPVLYTSRSLRTGERDGVHYHFRTRAYIEALPRERFAVAEVRELLQAVDVENLKASLRSGSPVVINIHPALWTALELPLRSRLGDQLKIVSVFLTAIDPAHLRALNDDEAQRAWIERQVQHYLTWRGKDGWESIRRRASDAANEILAALDPCSEYEAIIVSAPEGPDGEDEWTCSAVPEGRALAAVQHFYALIQRHTACGSCGSCG